MKRILLNKNEKYLFLFNNWDIIFLEVKQMKLINRDMYLRQLIDVYGTPDIKVIIGVRRSGKSKLMEAFHSYLVNEYENVNIIHINLILPENESLKEYHALYDYVNEKYIVGQENVLMIDEVQMCEGFEKAIIGFHTSEKYDIYITGSNAFLLSSDLATLFTGRTFRIEVYPFSFKEFCKYYNLTDVQSALDRYLVEGGMSGSYVYKNDAGKDKYLKDIYSTLIMRDIVQKFGIRKKVLIENVSDFLMDNISNITSARSITTSISNGDAPASNATITSYMKYLCNAYAFYKVRKYDIRGKKYLTSHDKYYLCDHSFRYAFLGKRNMNYGRTLENIVAIELLRRGYDIYVGALYKKEIDFVAMKHNEKIYIQVSDNISDSKTLERELVPLKAIKDAYPKLLLARTRNPKYDIEGIQVIDIAEWLFN